MIPFLDFAPVVWILQLWCFQPFSLQVRRMVGALVAVGQNRLQPHHIKELLAARDLMAYPLNTIAPPDGLFLKHVEYYKSGEQTEASG